jgi:hypothetical protein
MANNYTASIRRVSDYSATLARQNDRSASIRRVSDYSATLERVE